MDWSVDETIAYKDKDLLSLKVPDLPNDAGGIREFWNSLKSEISAIDRTVHDLLIRWVDISRTLLGDLQDVMTILDQDSQGLVRLDRTLAKLLAEKGKSHQIFAMRFAQYTEACHNTGKSPKGRVYLAMIAQRFRLDRSRGRTISLLHLYSVQLHSFKLADIQDFLNRCLLYTSPSPRDGLLSRMPSSA